MRAFPQTCQTSPQRLERAAQPADLLELCWGSCGARQTCCEWPRWPAGFWGKRCFLGGSAPLRLFCSDRPGIGFARARCQACALGGTSAGLNTSSGGWWSSLIMSGPRTTHRPVVFAQTSSPRCTTATMSCPSGRRSACKRMGLLTEKTYPRPANCTSPLENPLKVGQPVFRLATRI